MKLVDKFKNKIIFRKGREKSTTKKIRLTNLAKYLLKLKQQQKTMEKIKSLEMVTSFVR